jgi:hypothetical protein
MPRMFEGCHRSPNLDALTGGGGPPELAAIDKWIAGQR